MPAPRWTPAEEELLALGMLRAGTRYPAIAALLLPPFAADELAAQVQRRSMQKSSSLVKVGASGQCAGSTVLRPCRAASCGLITIQHTDCCRQCSSNALVHDLRYTRQLLTCRRAAS